MKETMMRALVKSAPGPEGLTLEQVSVPKPAGDQLLVRVRACAICGTDVHIRRDEYLHYPPVTLGHEFFGDVVEVGAQAAGFAVGDQVTAMTATSTCGQCPACKSGYLMRCEQRRSVGSGFNGAMADYIVIPASICYRIPDNHRDQNYMAVCEPMSCAAHLVFDQCEIRGGDVVVVMGPGALGQATAQMAKAAGAFVIVSGVPKDQERLDLAMENGADACCADPAALKELVLKHNPYGADVVLECSGAVPALKSAIEICRRGGQIGQLGLFGRPIEFPMDQLVMKEIRLNVSMGSSHQSWQRLMTLFAQNAVHADKLVSAVFPLERWEEAFAMAESGSGYRIVLVP
ncbi:alcohol dehydrogenase catalytic domain-containing protein [Enterocloster lavalensis]|uniref:alcohol dehydrogenase catalytic domain-containing protein n=1 Tax=Enterocloster lavalensis TaxID=460384 RepID=UPI0023F57061|nr:alcohol dehydrogenase catalytic domain-containing protein [Enterocloster lavalensis]